MTARRIGYALWLGLIALHVVWLGWIAPPARGGVGLLLAVIAPLLLPWLLVPRQPARAQIVVGMLCLFYFCHGVALGWSDASVRGLALIEILLSLGFITCLGWGARGYKRKR